jgi:putative tricarboxylic transport membrane protein
MAKRVLDLLFTVMVLVGSIYLWGVADLFPVFAKYKNVDSGFWPKIILVMMAILSVLILYENIAALRVGFREKREASSGCAPEDPATTVNWKKIVLMGALCIAYCGGLSIFGFVIATIVFMWLAIAVIGGANRMTTIVFPPIFTGLLAVIFVKVLELSLPRGVWLFHEFSLLLY